MSDAPTETPPGPPPPPPPAPPPPGGRHRRLTRSTSDRVLGGVAGGLAREFGIDPILVRIGFIVATLLGGSGIIAYAVLWVVLPPDDGSSPIVHGRRHDPAVWGGLALLVFGVISLFNRVWPTHGPGAWAFLWPLALIGGGIAILVLRANEAAPATAADSGAMGTNALPAVDVDLDANNTAPTEEQPRTAWAPPTSWPVGSPRRPGPHFGPRSRPPRPRRPPSFLGPITMSALLIFVGVAALLGAVGAVTVDPAVVASIALLMVGAALGVGAFFGRARGLIALGVLVTLVAGVLAAIDVPVRGGIGERDYHPRSAAAVRNEYRLGIGELRVDLSDVTWARGSRHDVDVRLGIGETRIVVPRGVTVVVDGHAGMGAVEIAGHQQNGVDADDHVRIATAAEGAPQLHVDAEVGIGHLLVEREGALR